MPQTPAFLKPGSRRPRINRAHPLASSLLALVDPPHGELITLTPPTIVDTHGVIAAGQCGLGAKSDQGGGGQTGGIKYVLPSWAPLYRIGPNWSAILVARISNITGNYGTAAGVAYKADGDNPYYGWSPFNAYSATGQGVWCTIGGSISYFTGLSAWMLQDGQVHVYYVESVNGNLTFDRDGVQYDTGNSISAGTPEIATNKQPLWLGCNNQIALGQTAFDQTVFLLAAFNRVLTKNERVLIAQRPFSLLDFGDLPIRFGKRGSGGTAYDVSMTLTSTPTQTQAAQLAAVAAEALAATPGHSPAAQLAAVASETLSVTPAQTQAAQLAALASETLTATPAQAQTGARGQSPSASFAATPGQAQAAQLAAVAVEVLSATPAQTQAAQLAAVAAETITATPGQTQAAQLAAVATLPLSSTPGEAQSTGGASLSDSMTLASTPGQAQSVQLAAVASETLTSTPGQSTPAQLAAQASESLAATPAQAQAAQLAAVASETLNVTPGFSTAVGGASYNDAMTLAATAGFTTSAKLDAVAAETLSATPGQSTPSQLVAQASEGLAATPAQTQAAQLAALASEALASTPGFSANIGGANISDSMTLTSTPGQAQSAQLGAVAAETLNATPGQAQTSSRGQSASQDLTTTPGQAQASQLAAVAAETLSATPAHTPSAQLAAVASETLSATPDQLLIGGLPYSRSQTFDTTAGFASDSTSARAVAPIVLPPPTLPQLVEPPVTRLVLPTKLDNVVLNTAVYALELVTFVNRGHNVNIYRDMTITIEAQPVYRGAVISVPAMVQVCSPSGKLTNYTQDNGTLRYDTAAKTYEADVLVDEVGVWTATWLTSGLVTYKVETFSVLEIPI